MAFTWYSFNKYAVIKEVDYEEDPLRSKGLTKVGWIAFISYMVLVVASYEFVLETIFSMLSGSWFMLGGAIAWAIVVIIGSIFIIRYFSTELDTEPNESS